MLQISYCLAILLSLSLYSYTKGRQSEENDYTFPPSDGCNICSNRSNTKCLTEEKYASCYPGNLELFHCPNGTVCVNHDKTCVEKNKSSSYQVCSYKGCGTCGGEQKSFACRSFQTYSRCMPGGVPHWGILRCPQNHFCSTLLKRDSLDEVQVPQCFPTAKYNITAADCYKGGDISFKSLLT